MEGNELISFNIIACAGDAKSYYYEAIQYAKNDKFESAYEKIKIGEKSQLEAHKSHMKLLTDAANGIETNIDILLLHAEDQLMSTETIKLMALEIIDLYKVLSPLKKLVK